MSGLRAWTVGQRRAIVAEYEEAPHGTKGLVLRRHQLTHRQMRTWTASRDAGLLEVGGSVRKASMTPKNESAELARLREANRRLEADLERARKDVEDRQRSLDALGKATALLQQLVSDKSATQK